MELVKNLIQFAWFLWSYVYHLMNFGLLRTRHEITDGIDTKEVARTHVDSMFDELKEA